jgi:small subunit ribosomal protein S7
MAGRITKSESQLRPDARYGDKVVSKFINCMMSDGKKTVAQKVVYDAFDIIDERLKKETNPDKPESSLEIFRIALERVMPFVEVRSKRVGGANYQVPIPVSRRRQQSLTFRWIIQAARSEKGRPMAERLANELYSASRGEGKAMQTREQTHRMAEANKAFAHFAR